jgi:hypothetical protein
MLSSNSANSNPPTTPLAAFAGFIGVLSIFLYYSGWIYRWAYFASFALDIKSLNFSTESFLFVTIQVFLGDFYKFLSFIILIIIDICCIKVILCLLKEPASVPLRPLQRNLIGIRSAIAKLLPGDLIKDLVIVACLLISLFFFARQQGVNDAYRDVISSTSTRPAITLIGPEAKLPLGQNYVGLTNSELKGSNFIGDKKALDAIVPIGADYKGPKTERVWRLLAENTNWVYLFPSGDYAPGKFPSVLSINTGEGRIQFLILSNPSQ